MNIPVLTIDGPSGAGKGTVSRILASRLGWHYLDSGAIYRALAIAVSDRRLPLDDPAPIARVAGEMGLEFQCNETLVVMLDGEDVTDRLPTEACGKTASVVAAYPAVRAALLEKQRAFRRSPGLVADGRDMGTVVFPEAEFKIFLTASLSARAERRYKQLKEKGLDVNLDKITSEVAERDRRDSERAAAPLAVATGALSIDSSAMTIDEVVERGLQFVGHRA